MALHLEQSVTRGPSATDLQPESRRAGSGRREHILHAAAQVFTDRGYEQATTKAIAAAANLSEGALYHHFASKRDLFLGVLQRVIEEIHTAAATPVAEGEDLRERYRQVISTRVRNARPQRRTLHALLSAVLADQELTEYVYRSLIRPGIEKAERGLQAATDAGVVRAVDLPVVARLVYAMGLGIDLLAQMGDAQTQALLAAGDRLADAFTELLLDGVAAAAAAPA